MRFDKDIAKEMAAGRFREDLFYRLSVVPIHLPSLRERNNDIPLLANHLLKQILNETGRKEVTISAAAMDVLMSHNWPGNVRELNNWIQFALVKCHSNAIDPIHFPSTIIRSENSPEHSLIDPGQHRRQKLNIEAVREALVQTKQNRAKAAKLLGVSRATFYRFLENNST